MMDVFGPKDLLQMIGHAEGISPGPDQRQQAFLDAIKKSQAPQDGQPLPAGVATGGPAMAAPGGGLPQMPPGVGANPLQAALAQRQMQGQPQPPQMGGVMGMQLLPQR